MDQTQEIHHKLRELRDQALAHSEEALDEKCAILCATAGEVLAGLEECFDHYLQHSGKVWK